jgi:hypothetical protein
VSLVTKRHISTFQVKRKRIQMIRKIYQQNEKEEKSK